MGYHWLISALVHGVGDAGGGLHARPGREYVAAGQGHRSTEPALGLDERHASTGIVGGDGGRAPSRSSPDDDDIEDVVGCGGRHGEV